MQASSNTVADSESKGDGHVDAMAGSETGAYVYRGKDATVWLPVHFFCCKLRWVYIFLYRTTAGPGPTVQAALRKKYC
jgi:hypothetical protein